MNEKIKGENISIKGIIKDILIEWFLSSTAHALPNIFKTNSIILKIIWGLCFITCTVYCIISSALNIKAYYDFNTYITTQTIQEIPTVFPAITICNLKFINKTKAKTYLDKILYFNGNPIFQLSNFGDATFRFATTQSYYIQASVSADKNLTANDRRAFGYEMSDMLLQCSFNWEACTANDFKQFFHPLYGNCFTFNNGTMNNGTTMSYKKVSVQGADYGLIMQLFTGQPDVQSQYEHTADGIIVVVHNQSTLPLLNGDRIIVSTGTETKINRNFISKLDSPYSNCLKDITKTSTFSSELFNYIVNTKQMQYNQQYCYLLCLQKKIISSCGCSAGFLPSYDDKQLCLSLTQISCFAGIVVGFNKNGATDSCVNECPIECNYVDYKISTNRAVFPNKYYKSLLMNNSLIKANNLTYDDLDRSVVKMNIFYESMTYYYTQEIASITSDTFLSNIGGTLGLFLGISILSLVELIELVVLILKTLIEFRLRGKIQKIPIGPETTLPTNNTENHSEPTKTVNNGTSTTLMENLFKS